MVKCEKLSLWDQAADKDAFYYHYYSKLSWTFYGEHLGKREKRKRQGPERKTWAAIIRNNMMMHIKNQKELLELKDEFIKIVKHKVNIQKSIEFPYSRNKQKTQF